MKFALIVLVVANLLLAAYLTHRAGKGGADAELLKLQMNADKVTLVTGPGAGPGDKPVAAASRGGTGGACLEWGVFTGPELAKAEAALAALQLRERVSQRLVPEATGYWVYVPPLKSKTELDQKVAELRQLGVQDMFVVQDNTDWKNAISLGIFRSEDAAGNFLAKLRAMGVRSAVAGARSGLVRFSVFVIRDPNDRTAARLTEASQAFPGSELKAVPCVTE